MHSILVEVIVAILQMLFIPSPMKTLVEPGAVAKLAPLMVRVYPPPRVPLTGLTELTTIL